MKVTIKDIAREAGVSISSVSLVLNEKDCRISQSTKDKIKEIARKYNYKVNQTARSLVTKESKILGLIIPDIENLFFSKLTKELESYCRAFGYFLITVNSNDELRKEIQLITLLESRNIDGLFIVVSNESFNKPQTLKMYLSKLTIPFVMIDRIYPDFNCNKIYFDNKLGVSLAINHFYKKGHRNIGCIAGGKENTHGISRLLSYYESMKKLNCTVENEYVYYGDYHFESGYLAGESFVNSDITGIFICNDMMTLGFMKYLHEINKTIPEHISIISYDNILYPFMLGNEVTSIEQNVSELAKHATDILIENITHPNIDKKTICLAPTLIEKDSVKDIS